MLEKERKVLLTRDQYISLQYYMEKKYLLLHPTVLIQKNHYYDTSDHKFLNSHQSVRIRETQDRRILQHKKRIELRKKTAISEEREFAVSQVSDYLVHAAVYHEPLKLMGCLTTRRMRYELGNGVRVDLDENQYLGKTDYELEIEFAGEIPVDFERFFSSENPTQSKYERFMELYLNAGWYYGYYPGDRYRGLEESAVHIPAKAVKQPA